MIKHKAPAKINWFLNILGKRDDGMHEIQSLMQCVDIYDELSFSLSDKINLITDADIKQEDNLVYKAAMALKKATTCTKGATIKLVKNIPLEAGLGGGSSDAAETLLGLNKLWKLKLSQDELSIIGAGVGSDVPFFIWQSPATVEGRGERVRQVEINTPHILLMAKPSGGVSARWAYSNIVKMSQSSIDTAKFIDSLEKSDFESIGKLANNDLEEAVLKSHEEVNQLKLALDELGAEFSLMSGSGTTVFGVFTSITDADAALKGLKDFFPECWCTVARTIASKR